MNIKKEVQGGQSQLYLCQFIACCMFRLFWKSNIRQLKMYIKKDNINTIYQNDTFSGSWHVSFTQFQVYKPNQIKVHTVLLRYYFLNTAVKVSLLIEWRSDGFVYFSYEYIFDLQFYCKFHLLRKWDMKNRTLKGKTSHYLLKTVQN